MAKLGSALRLQCSLNVTSQIRWDYFGLGEPLTSSPRVLYNGYNFSEDAAIMDIVPSTVNVTDYDTKWILTVVNVQFSHAGSYVCSDTSLKISHVINVQVVGMVGLVYRTVVTVQPKTQHFICVPKTM